MVPVKRKAHSMLEEHTQRRGRNPSGVPPQRGTPRARGKSAEEGGERGEKCEEKKRAGKSAAKQRAIRGVPKQCAGVSEDPPSQNKNVLAQSNKNVILHPKTKPTTRIQCKWRIPSFSKYKIIAGGENKAGRGITGWVIEWQVTVKGKGK